MTVPLRELAKRSTKKQNSETMTESYKTFHINGDVEPVSETLMGHITAWRAKGSIEFRRPDRSVVELIRFRLPQMKFDEQEIAMRFGLELARLFVDAFYRDFVIERYEIEKRRIQDKPRRRWLAISP
ncbi:MAG TPA: hypothetical protein VHV54_27210 [Candidatus Binatia bacterium]|nr:hypothetical protein [Candidatus Binatia bacterium]